MCEHSKFFVHSAAVLFVHETVQVPLFVVGELVGYQQVLVNLFVHVSFCFVYVLLRRCSDTEKFS